MRNEDVYEQLCGTVTLGREGRESTVNDHRVKPGTKVIITTERPINGKVRKGKAFPVLQIGSQARKGLVIQINLGDEKNPIVAGVSPNEVDNPDAPSPTAALEAELAASHRRAAKLERKIADMGGEVSEETEEMLEAEEEAVELRKANRGLTSENAALQKRIAELEGSKGNKNPDPDKPETKKERKAREKAEAEAKAKAEAEAAAEPEEEEVI